MIVTIRHAVDDWLDWSIVSPALRDKPVICRRNDADWERVVTADEMRPETNVAGLFWKRTGIYKEAQARMPIEGYQQLNSMHGNSGFLAGIGASLGSSLGQSISISADSEARNG